MWLSWSANQFLYGRMIMGGVTMCCAFSTSASFSATVDLPTPSRPSRTTETGCGKGATFVVDALDEVSFAVSFKPINDL